MARLIPARCGPEWLALAAGQAEGAGLNAAVGTSGAGAGLDSTAGGDSCAGLDAAVGAATSAGARSERTVDPGPRPPFLDAMLDPARELLSRGGKRWRPVLMVCVCEMTGGKRERILPLTPLVELAHTGSLIVDDIEDSAEYRRGGPAVHLLFGVDAAVNAGNLLYFFPALRIHGWGRTDAERSEAYRIYLEGMSRLHIGQGLDIRWHGKRDPVPTIGEYMRMCRYKTGSLARIAAELGALAGQAERTDEVLGEAELERRGLGSVAEKIGVAFQIMDDVTNLTSGNPGKKRGDDVVEGKMSLPVLLYLSRRPERRESLFEAFETAAALGMEKAGEVVERVIGELTESGAVEEARRTAADMMDEAGRAILAGYPASVPRDLIVEMARGFV